ncbi:MAG TPA: alkaline phosphatase, partial [Fibrobacteria bacterium]|nr:alkaline phosphatase [Fibrobacteria bacterium]
GQTITGFRFLVDGREVNSPAGVAGTSVVTTGLVSGLPTGTAVLSLRAYSSMKPGVHSLTIKATQSDNQVATATGNFEIVVIDRNGTKVRNVIILMGDGMGASHRTAARIMAKGYTQGKAKGVLAMDSFPYTGMVMTASLNSIITDSSPGMSNYVNGNKAANNQEGVFPDDTQDAFDNPRVEYLSEFLHRTQGKSLGIVTTADVFDATPAANAVHTSNRGNGTGIADQYLDDRGLTGLTVLMGGGRKWFLSNPSNSVKPQPVSGSQRRAVNDYMLPDDVVKAWKASKGALDPERDLISDFQKSGFTYAPDASSLRWNRPPKKLLGLFAFSNMNVAMDKIDGRRGSSTVTEDYGFPDQPMLDEMTEAALEVLSKNPKGFVAMIEGASIDKQSHLMDSDRWILETLEFDRAVQVAKDFASSHPQTLVLVTADHECAGTTIIGASVVDSATLANKAGQGQAGLRDKVVGTYEAARFPRYAMDEDGYPVTTDADYKMLIGYGANADRYEAWTSNGLPTQDSQQPFNGVYPLNTYPANPNARNQETGFLITGQVPGESAVHTGSDIPLSAFGHGARLFTGVMDNTDVFFKIAQATAGGIKPGNDRDEDDREMCRRKKWDRD